MRNRKILRNSGLISLFAASSLVLSTASPALATEQLTGAGGGIGYETGGSGQPQNCIEPPDPNFPGLMGTTSGSTFRLDHNGVYSASSQNQGPSQDPVGTYVGPTEMNIMVGPYVISPEGTYIVCGVPGPVPVSGWNVNSPANSDAGQVSCQGGSGTYQRRAFNAVEFRLHGICSVKGPQSDKWVVKETPTVHVVTGEMHPCVLPSPPFPEPIDTGLCAADPNAAAQLVTTYVAAGEDEELNNNPNSDPVPDVLDEDPVDLPDSPTQVTIP